FDVGNVRVTSYQVQVQDGAVPMGEVTFTFSTLTESYRPTDQYGQFGPPVNAEVDFKGPGGAATPRTSLLQAPPSHLSGNARVFLKVDDVKGEATDQLHQDQIPVESFSWSVNIANSPAVVSPQVMVSPQVFDVLIPVSKASPLLFADAGHA